MDRLEVRRNAHASALKSRTLFTTIIRICSQGQEHYLLDGANNRTCFSNTPGLQDFPFNTLEKKRDSSDGAKPHVDLCSICAAPLHETEAAAALTGTDAAAAAAPDDDDHDDSGDDFDASDLKVRLLLGFKRVVVTQASLPTTNCHGIFVKLWNLKTCDSLQEDRQPHQMCTSCSKYILSPLNRGGLAPGTVDLVRIVDKVRGSVTS
jgi:hypothetical protein